MTGVVTMHNRIAKHLCKQISDNNFSVVPPFKSTVTDAVCRDRLHMNLVFSQSYLRLVLLSHKPRNHVLPTLD